MTALNKQAYRADGGDIGIGRLKEIADNAYSDEEKRWLAQRVLSLLDENLQLQRDKDSLEAVAIAMRDDMWDAREKLEAAEKRIAELEARAFNPAILDVIAERQRQQSVEGWTPEHDDQYGKSQLLWASSCYLLNTIQPFNRIPMDWPWDSSWWKPTNSRRDLVKAGALILAEIERIDRAAGIGVKGE
ncbi:TPA: ead/Ea22-like family protein [Salmonella enterica subsp. enterica serovar Saintpaul]